MTNYLVMFFITVTTLCSTSQNDIIQDNEVKRTFRNPVFDGADPWYIWKKETADD